MVKAAEPTQSIETATASAWVPTKPYKTGTTARVIMSLHRLSNNIPDGFPKKTDFDMGKTEAMLASLTNKDTSREMDIQKSLSNAAMNINSINTKDPSARQKQNIFLPELATNQNKVSEVLARGEEYKNATSKLGETKNNVFKKIVQNFNNNNNKPQAELDKEFSAQLEPLTQKVEEIQNQKIKLIDDETKTLKTVKKFETVTESISVGVASPPSNLSKEQMDALKKQQS